MNTARHDADVDAIAAHVKHFHDRQEPFRINHGSTNSTRLTRSGRISEIHIGHLRSILDINVSAKTVLVEPNVSMDRLAHATMKYGLVPPVVMEFPGITVGGGYAGTSGESSSFKHGFFDRTINHVEMILANGEVIRASRSERPDLFNGAAGACGTLGVTTLVELQLIEAKKFVETTYHPVDGISMAVEKIEQIIKHPEAFDYIDGILLSKTRGAVITGRLTNDDGGHEIRTFRGAWDPWFYLHVEEILGKHESPVTESVPLDDYLFRYDRGGFWVGRSAFQYFYTPFNRYTRWFLDQFTRTRMMYKALHASGNDKSYIVQDLALPMANAAEFVDFTNKAFGIYPLWLCPLRQSEGPTFHPHSLDLDRDNKSLKPMLNIGLWGYGSSDRNTFLKTNRQLETRLHELGGMKWLYAQTFYTEDEFWQIYDRTWYESLRQRYGATSLPSVYDKVKMDTQTTTPSCWTWLRSLWPFSGIWGLIKAIQSGQYLLEDKSRWTSIEEKDRLEIE